MPSWLILLQKSLIWILTSPKGLNPRPVGQGVGSAVVSGPETGVTQLSTLAFAGLDVENGAVYDAQDGRSDVRGAVVMTVCSCQGPMQPSLPPTDQPLQNETSMMLLSWTLVVRTVVTSVSPIETTDDMEVLGGGELDDVVVVLLATVLVGEAAKVLLLEADTVEVAETWAMLLVELEDANVEELEEPPDMLLLNESVFVMLNTETLVGAGKSVPVSKTMGNCEIQLINDVMMAGLFHQVLVEQALPVSDAVSFNPKQPVVVVQYVEHDWKEVMEPLTVLEQVTPQNPMDDVEHELVEADDVMVPEDTVVGPVADGRVVLVSDCEFVGVDSGVMVVGAVSDAGPIGGGTGSGGNSHPLLLER